MIMTLAAAVLSTAVTIGMTSVKDGAEFNGKHYNTSLAAAEACSRYGECIGIMSPRGRLIYVIKKRK